MWWEKKEHWPVFGFLLNIKYQKIKNTKRSPSFKNSKWNAHHQLRSLLHIFEFHHYWYRPVCRQTRLYRGEDLWLEHWGSGHGENWFFCQTRTGLTCYVWNRASSLVWASKNMKYWQWIQVKLHGKASQSHRLSCTHLQ